MAATSLPAGTVLLTGKTIPLVAEALKTAQRARGRNGLPPLPAWAELLHVLSRAGHEDTTDEPTDDSGLMTTTDAAALLGCSTRTARRLAPKLGGQLVGGRLLLDRAAVLEHHEGSTTP